MVYSANSAMVAEYIYQLGCMKKIELLSEQTMCECL